MTMLAPLRRLQNTLRFAAAKLRKGTVRYYCGDLPEFYAALDAEGIRPVVLRWADDVPLDPATEQTCPHDVDHLIADDTAERIGHIAARFPGPVKCDFYSVSGQSGSAYRAYPYYPPVLALEILDRAVRDERGFWRPAPRDEYFAFAYHLAYHKGHRSGFPSGFDSEPATPAKRDYAAELRRLGDVADVDVPGDLSLRALHDHLSAHDWDMPEDLVTRWPDAHPFLAHLAQMNAQSVAAEARLAHDITVFILRADCDTEELRSDAVSQIAERFTILRDLTLTDAQVTRVMRKTRGGNWIEKYCKGPVPPTRALICRNAQTPGPLPAGMSPEKVKERYPHVHHTDVLIKRDIRKALNARLGAGPDRVLLHATDNPEEAIVTLRAILGDDLHRILNALRGPPKD